MKKLFLSFLIFFLALPVVWANDVNYDIKQTSSVAQIQTELQALINNATSGDTIIVTGTKTNADVRLQVNIPAGKTVKWKATYKSDAYFSANALISFTGDGMLEVAGGTLTTGANNVIFSDGKNATVKVSSGNLSSTTGETIKTTGENAIVSISGGTVKATSENAVYVKGENAKVFVSGGTLSNAADYAYPVIFIDAYNNTKLNVIISGTGKIEATEEFYAIITYGGIEVKDDAQVSAAMHSAIYSTYDNHITISGKSKVTGGTYAIYLNSGGKVEIKDNAQVISKNGGCAIGASGGEVSLVSITGGLVFASNSNIHSVINCDYSVSDTGMLLAWDKTAGNTNYEGFTTDDILKLPDSATAHWDRKGGGHGIFYANGENKGFIPLHVSVLSIEEPLLPNLTVYPNPVSNILHVETGSNVAPEIKVYSIQGILLLQAKGNEIDISSLDRGIYFAEIDGVCRKVVKQ